MSLHMFIENNINAIWIFGDFNLPDFDWTNESPKSTCKLKKIYDDLLENLTNFSREQIVKISTQNENILDLLLTNQPSKVHNTKTLPNPGSSDHYIVFHEISMPIGRPLQPKRNIELCGKANCDQF